MYIASKQTFDIALNSIKNNPHLQKVVLVKRPPRFDSPIAAHLSDFGNNVLDDLWMRNNCPLKIVIKQMDIECDDA